MRLDELFNKPIVLEAEGEASTTDNPVVPSATIIPAHIFDMTGKPYPTDSDGNVPPELFQPVKVQVGLETGQVSPEQAEQLNHWYSTGMKPGGGEDYNKNWFITDLAYEVIGSADDLARGLSMGAAVFADGALKRSTTVNLLLSSMGLKTFDDPSKYTTVDVINSIYDTRDDVFKFFGAEEGFPNFQEYTDQKYRDDKTITAGAVNSWGDLAGLLVGKGWNNIRWQGVVGMIASELPSDLLNLAAMSAAATAGTAASGGNPLAGGAAAFAANAGLSALEAMGFAAFEIDGQVQQLYDDKILQTTDQWKNALEIVGGDEDAAVRYIQKSTYSANVMRSIGGPDVNLTTMQAVGITAGSLDAIVDRLVLGAKIKVPGLQNFAAKATIAGATEAGDEALQQLFINAGLIDKAGAPITVTDGLINAAWQGYIIGKGRSVGADTLRAFGSGAAAIEKARATLRNRLYGVDNDPENFKNVVDMLADAPEISAMSNYLTNDQGELNFEKLIDENMPTFDSLTRQQKRGKGTIEINGEQMRSSEALKLIRTNDYARQYLPTMQNTDYNSVENEYQATFENGTEALRAARLLGFDPDADFDPEEDVDQSIEFLEKVLRYDVRVSGRTEFESPNFDTMTGQQRVQFFRDGVVEAGRFKFTREDIVKQSLSDGVAVPQNVLEFVQDDPQRVDARPTLDPEIQILKNRIANSAAMQRAEQALADDQAAWDEEFGDNPDAADFPRPIRDDEDYAEIFRQAEVIAGPLQAQVNMAEAKLKQQQAVWDNQNGDTNNADGGVKVQGQMLNHMYIGYDDAILRQARKEKLQRQEADKEKVTVEQEIQKQIEEKAREANDVASISPDSSLAKANVVYNATMKMAQADMSVEAAQSMVEKLEKTYPGITKEIMKGWQDEGGNPDWDRYDQFQQAINSKPPETPQITVLQPGLQRTVDGETFKWVGYQWRSVDTGRMANKQQQTKLVTPEEAEQIPYIDAGTYNSNVEANTYLDNLDKNNTETETAPADIAPETPVDPSQTPPPNDPANEPDDGDIPPSDPSDINTDLDVSPQTLVAPDVKAGDNITYRNKKGETRDAEVVQTLPNGNVQVTLNGTTFALTPAQIAAATSPPTDASDDPSNTGTTGSRQAGSDNNTTDKPSADNIETEPKDDEVFDPSAATTIDAQYADVEVPQSVKDEYADVLATQNGIKIMNFLDSLPDPQAGSLRFNTPRPGQDGDANDETPATTTTSSRPDALDLPSTSRPDVVADPSQIPPAPNPAKEPDDGDIPPVASQDQTPPAPNPANEPDDGDIPPVASQDQTPPPNDPANEPDDGDIPPVASQDQTPPPNDPAKEPDDGDIPTTTTADTPPPGTGTVPVLPPEVKPRDTSTKKGDNITLLPRELPQRDDTDLDPDDIIIPTTPQQGSGRGDGQAELDARREKARADQEAKQAELDARREKARADQAKANQQANDKFQNDRIDRIAQQSDDQAQADKRVADLSQTPPPNDPANEPNDGDIPTTTTANTPPPGTSNNTKKPPESEITKKGDENTADKLPVAPPPSVNTTKKKPTGKVIVKTTTKKNMKKPKVGAGLIGDFGNKKKSPPNILPYIPPPPQDDPLDLGKWKRYK